MALIKTSILVLATMASLALAAPQPHPVAAPRPQSSGQACGSMTVSVGSNYVDSNGFCTGNQEAQASWNPDGSPCVNFSNGNCATVTAFSGSLEDCTAYFYSGTFCGGDQVAELGGPQGAATNTNGATSVVVVC